MARRDWSGELATSGDATSCDDFLAPCETLEGSRRYEICFEDDDDEPVPPSSNDTVVMSAAHLATLRAELLAQAERDALPTLRSMPAVSPETVQAAWAERARARAEGRRLAQATSWAGQDSTTWR